MNKTLAVIAFISAIVLFGCIGGRENPTPTPLPPATPTATPIEGNGASEPDVTGGYETEDGFDDFPTPIQPADDEGANTTPLPKISITVSDIGSEGETSETFDSESFVLPSGPN
jgi:hypothetical protein